MSMRSIQIQSNFRSDSQVCTMHKMHRTHENTKTPQDKSTCHLYILLLYPKICTPRTYIKKNNSTSGRSSYHTKLANMGFEGKLKISQPRFFNLKKTIYFVYIYVLRTRYTLVYVRTILGTIVVSCNYKKIMYLPPFLNTRYQFVIYTCTRE